MTKILAISGSLRKGSFNTALMRAAEALEMEGVSIEGATLHGIPLYDGDVEATEGIPEAVEALRAQVIAADGVLLVTPEYNNSIPGVFKNAIDWLSRGPQAGETFKGRPVALIGASPGGFGTILSQNAWLPVLRTLGMDLWTGGRMMVSRANTLIEEDKGLTDEATLANLRQFIEGFVGSIRSA